MSGSERPDFSTALAVAYLPWLFKHVVRSWLYGAKLTQYRGLTPDAELVAVSVLLHDLGLALVALRIVASRLWERTSVAPLPLSHNMGERRAETVWDSIALHTTASIAQHKSTD